MIRILAAVCAFLLPGPAMAQLANQLFGAHQQPSLAQPQVFGSYAKGCGAGFVRLPETGPTWQAMRLSRNRNWGHPEMIAYVQDLSRAAQQIGWRGVYVGDISQPRGGPMTSGHASHQMGLDADIWMLPPARLDLSVEARENLSSISVRTEDQLRVNSNWTPQHLALLRAAASDPRVDRIFVAAAVKLEMCRTATRSDRAWLQRIRPAVGHNYHFHVRLGCPAGSSGCITQTPTVAELSDGGDGCDDTLQWWVTDFLNPPPRVERTEPPAPRARHPREYTLADLPAQCTNVVRAQ
ncbi:penicillin-insensitive murein endopeptidase [Roseicitreum antarcticum]|uniref:Penicillin-insensitive murein endopeptidase n=1 Tax=Roseicitreum antarcticum TaxID=564137 RepID=A0A1H3AXC8_9RHOB|nr:penicillin-insensitive murein endopeptidase [Roseicitreum antarcticum]SDX33469.1 penicillin-insensitive murein endopeptidase [Roseicitreum antarcticum]